MRKLFALIVVASVSVLAVNAQDKATVKTENRVKLVPKEALRKAEAQPEKVEQPSTNVQRKHINSTKRVRSTEKQEKLRVKQNAPKAVNVSSGTDEK